MTGLQVYPQRKDLADRNFWVCTPCDAYVGCHQKGAVTQDTQGRRLVSDGTVPLGRLANAELRRAKQRAHTYFDPLWNDSFGGRRMPRAAAYAWLANQLSLPVHRCHIGMFDVAMCERVAQVCEAQLTRLLDTELGLGDARRRNKAA